MKAFVLPFLIFPYDAGLTGHPVVAVVNRGDVKRIGRRLLPNLWFYNGRIK
jgi:hypothetical protein